MFKYCILFVLLIPCWFVVAETDTLVNNIVIIENDSVFKYMYYYDDSQNKTVENKYWVENKTAHPLSRTEWVYEGNHCTIQRHQKWKEKDGRWDTHFEILTTISDGLAQQEDYIKVNGDQRVHEKTIVNTYSDQKLVSIHHFQGFAEARNLQSEKYFTYHANKKIDQQVMRYYASGSDLMHKFQYIYDQHGQLDSLVFMEVVKGTPTNKQLTTFHYDKQGNESNIIQKKWNKASQKWENESLTQYSYNENNQLVHEIYSHYNVLFWQPNTKYEYSYNSSGYLNSKIMYRLIYQEWRKIFTISYEEIINDRPGVITSTHNFWGGKNGESVSNYIPFNFNDEISLLKAEHIEINYSSDINDLKIIQEASDKEWLKIYPNPSNGVFYINPQHYVIDMWEVYDYKGLLIKKEHTRFRTGIVDLKGMPDGVYFIRAYTTDNQELKQKIIIQQSM